MNVNDLPREDYSLLDRPEILRLLFYPRPEWNLLLAGRSYVSLSIPVDRDVIIGGFLHSASLQAPNILFFHGNGEIASDYHDFGPIFTERGYNFIPVDYRGYGRSSGSPSVTSMMDDCHVIFDYVRAWLKEQGYTGPMIVMGRSLGSASAIAVTHHSQDKIDGLIVESGFAHLTPLLVLLGIPLQQWGIREDAGPENCEKMKEIHKPTLVIHAQYDHIIALSEGQALYEACAAHDKKMLIISGANHNNIFLAGMNDYLQSIAWLTGRLGTRDE